MLSTRKNVAFGHVTRPTLGNSLRIDDQCVELKRLYLTAAERKKGFGKRLLELALSFAGKAGYRRMRLETTSRFREAVALYGQNGFREANDINPAPGYDLVFEKKLSDN
jgi:GNAT superfamily N-acetyltransferase